MPSEIAFIGLGVMGAPMAKRLVAAGHRLSVYNRTASRCAPLVAAGAQQALTAADAARGKAVIITMVTDGPDVEDVLLGPEGAVRGATAGATFIDMSTIAPSAARRIGRDLREHGFRFLDAPVTGGDVGAREGTLSILVGGEREVLDRVRDILSALGKRITHCGPQGSGQTAKACNQILCAMNMVGLVEALHLARLGGLDRQVVVEALAAGAGGSWALEKLGPRINAGDFSPGFMIKLIQKDLRIVQEIANGLGLPLDGTALAQRLFGDNEAHGEQDLGTQAMYKVLERCSSE